MTKPQMSRWLEGCLWSLIVIRMASVLLLPSTVTRVPIVLVAIRPKGEVLLASAATADVARLVTIAVVAVLSRVLLSLAMFVLLTRYAPALAARLLRQRQLVAVERLRSIRTRGALLVICSVHPTKTVVVACALAKVRFVDFVVSVILGNTLVVTLYLSIGRRYAAELYVVIDWVVARSGWITLALVPLIGLIIVAVVWRGRQ
jgi:uncharacterized membrane protein YdjX (TVP38/TMEM64 family)